MLRIYKKSKTYYEVARKGSLDVNHPGMKILKKVAEFSHNILDLGCGEGTRLAILVKKVQRGVGIDVSKKAITIAKKRHPNLKFICGDIDKLPFSNESFDLVYSAFVLEHLESPEKCIEEGIRVTKKGGNLILVAPNYGAPNRSSPPFKGSRFKKLVIGFFKDFYSLVRGNSGLAWEKVEPIRNRKYQIDYDTKVEPYLGTLIPFLKKRGMKIRYFSSCWEEELAKANILQKVFRLASDLGIYPFYLWGPHLLIWAQKLG